MNRRTFSINHIRVCELATFNYELPMEYAAELKHLIEMEMEGSVR
ncbi:MAG: hypothetical protein ACW99A_12710 [Candidatus Kariarchaeaceae archaeon]|jgi:hypothetical protein